MNDISCAQECKAVASDWGCLNNSPVGQTVLSLLRDRWRPPKHEYHYRSKYPLRAHFLPFQINTSIYASYGLNTILWKVRRANFKPI